jgi:hypothetical protein
MMDRLAEAVDSAIRVALDEDGTSAALSPMEEIAGCGIVDIRCAPAPEES